jgi:ABC-type sugar transport system ATPase subunit
VAGFIGSPGMNFIAAEAVAADAGAAHVRLADGGLVRCEVDASPACGPATS